MPETIKKVPQRRCVGCRKSFPQEGLIRFTYTGGELKIDEEKRSVGRGCYVCKNKDCIEKAIKSNGFARSFRCAVPKDEIEKIGRLINAE